MNDSQNDQSKQNDQIDVLMAIVEEHDRHIICARFVYHYRCCSRVNQVNRQRFHAAKVLAGYDKAYYVGTDSKESGIIQGQLIEKHWKAGYR
jgi:methyl-galactoside transport system substrate-binding protein